MGPPVPIPNTEVKHTYADDSCRVTGRENRYREHKHSPLAQSVERRTVNPQVVGSSPTGGAKMKATPFGVAFVFSLDP